MKEAILVSMRRRAINLLAATATVPEPGLEAFELGIVPQVAALAEEVVELCARCF